MATISTIGTINTLDDLIQFSETAAHIASTGALRQSEIWYRGHSDPTWTLAPLAFREASFDPRDAVSIAREFRAHAPLRRADCPGKEEGDSFAWLSLMRHYGTPNCLLDWTKSLLAAAYFACEGDHPETRKTTESAHIYALLPERLRDGGPALDELDYTVQGCANEAFSELPYPEPTPPDRTYFLPVVPRETSLRMLVQASTFTLHRITTPLETVSGADTFLYRAVLTRDGRLEITRALRALGISIWTLNPDLSELSLELVNRFQRRKASPTT